MTFLHYHHYHIQALLQTKSTQLIPQRPRRGCIRGLVDGGDGRMRRLDVVARRLDWLVTDGYRGDVLKKKWMANCNKYFYYSQSLEYLG